jgi:hypothetical protein
MRVCPVPTGIHFSCILAVVRIRCQGRFIHGGSRRFARWGRWLGHRAGVCSRGPVRVAGGFRVAELACTVRFVPCTSLRVHGNKYIFTRKLASRAYLLGPYKTERSHCAVGHSLKHHTTRPVPGMEETMQLLLRCCRASQVGSLRRASATT